MHTSAFTFSVICRGRALDGIDHFVLFRLGLGDERQSQGRSATIKPFYQNKHVYYIDGLPTTYSHSDIIY